MTASSTRTISVLIADDHALFRESLRKLLENESDLVVVGEAGDGRDAARLAAELRPDVLLLDLRMPAGPGLQCLREMARAVSPVLTLVLTADAGDSEVVEALQLGARGVVMKHSAPDMLFKSIRSVVAGEYWVGRERVADLIGMLRQRQAAEAERRADPTFGLTPRELQMVSAVVAGCSNGDIAAKFSISPKTVKHHLTNIFDKLGVSNRLELALYAVNHQLFPGRRDPPSRPPGSSR
jgi:two-component system, NarL family, nitrate/nitrite response regulator NarL